MSEPIRPEDVAGHKIKVLPSEVFEVFNDLIARSFSNGQATVMQKDVVDALVEKGFSKEQIFAQKLLDVVEAYRAKGWEVEYDKPGFNETYGAAFIFSH